MTHAPSHLELHPHTQLVAAGKLPSGGVAELDVSPTTFVIAEPGHDLGVEEVEDRAQEPEAGAPEGEILAYLEIDVDPLSLL